MVAVAVLSGLLAAAATALLADSARRRGGPRRQAHLLLAVAAAVALATLAGRRWSALLGATEHGAHSAGSGLGWASLTGDRHGADRAGVLRRAAPAARRDGGPRPPPRGSLLDGLIMAAAIWFVGWVLFSEPTRLLGAADPDGLPGDPAAPR